MDDYRDAYAVEWSASAGQFHVQPISETLKQGALSYFEDKPSDYILVAIGRTHADAMKLVIQLEDQKAGK